ncbi:excitatory amino acid transporter 2-like [Saccostrea echinata]|uniref:excitatory amino acid transporter 2-like n=1 Tax=Saccostrea echinata TaxID=191078 RepID=UPI002A832A30|nr:excitatory amino acid transporter 2-like [Saccostrea echinata]
MSENPRQHALSCLRTNALLLFVLVGIGVGLGVGFGLRKHKPSEDVILWIGLPGEVYMRLLKMTILPLIVSTIITGTATIDPKSNGRITSITFAYILIINAFGAILGIIMYFIFKPGEGITNDISMERAVSFTTTKVETSDMFADMIRNLFPENMITACFQKTQTMTYITKTKTELNVTTTTKRKEITTAAGVNILGLIVVSTLFGIAASKLRNIVKPFLDFFYAVSHLVIMALNWIIMLTPIGVTSLIASAILKVSNLETVFNSLGMYVLALSIGMGLHLLGVIPLLYFIATRKNPLYYIAVSLRAWMTVFAVASSAIGMPELLKVVETKLHVDKRISRYTVPLGVALTRAGSTQFISLSSLFLMNLEGLTPSAPTIVLVWLLTTVSSLAIPSIPSAGIVTVLIILSSLNMDVTNIGLLMALEWYDDRIRSTNNATSVVMGAVIADRFCGARLPPVDPVTEYEINDKVANPEQNVEKEIATGDRC